MHKYFASILIFCFYSGFSQGSHSFDKRAIELNNNAVSLMSTDDYNGALLLLDSAIQIDSSYYYAYLNKVNIYCSQKHYHKAIEYSKHAIREKPDLAESVMFLGMLYDKIGEPEKAKRQYQLAIEVFNNRISLSDKNRNSNKINRACALYLLDPEKGKTEIEKLFKSNPNDVTLQILKEFGKENLLAEIFKD